MGVILLITFAAITDYSLCILIKAGISTGTATYQDLVQSAFGLPGFYILTFMQFMYPFIAMISYNVIIGDTITKVFMRIFKVSTDSVLGNRHFIVIMTSLFVTLPLSLHRNISKLNKASLTSLLFILVILVFVIVRMMTLVHEIPPSPESFGFANRGITKAIGVIAFAYMCHHNSFLLFAALKDPTQRRWNRVTHVSLALSCFIILLFGIGGYVSFTYYSQGDLLENYCMDDDYANVARLMFTVTIMLTYPIECFVTREVLDNAFFCEQIPFKPGTPHRHDSADCPGLVCILNSDRLPWHRLGAQRRVGSDPPRPTSCRLPRTSSWKTDPSSRGLSSRRSCWPCAGLPSPSGGAVVAFVDIQQRHHLQPWRRHALLPATGGQCHRSMNGGTVLALFCRCHRRSFVLDAAATKETIILENLRDSAHTIPFRLS
uniref:Putative sodium-coupled neutral amino acid transporter 11 n=1 Tax=Ixodes ricinus TaxID=34613 RepID=V5ICH6_IXORI